MTGECTSPCPLNQRMQPAIDEEAPPDGFRAAFPYYYLAFKQEAFFGQAIAHAALPEVPVGRLQRRGLFTACCGCCLQGFEG